MKKQQLMKNWVSGEPISTTPEPLPTTTTPAMPTAAPDEHASLTVYLYGRAAADYKSTQTLSLKQDIVSMGTEYCRDQNCPLNESITCVYSELKNRTSLIPP